MLHTTRRTALAVVLALLASLGVIASSDLSTPALAETAGSTTPDRRAVSGAIAAGYVNTCAILSGGSVRCWGAADHGVLGRGTGTVAPGDTQYDIGDNETPGSAPAVDLGAGRTATSISMRYKHVCALLDNGSVRCWGNGQGDVDTDLEGVLGTLGKKIVGDDETPATNPVVDLGAGRTAVAVTAGWLQSCAILDTGAVKCWGQNNGGQLGMGPGAPTGAVAAAQSGTVALGAGRTAAAISSGRQHTCAILDTGAVSCWGYNNHGQLGRGDTNPIGDDETPAGLPTVDLGPGRTATAIAAGYEHTCAILDNGALRCWGRNDVGQLGLGNTAHLGDDEAVASVSPIDLGAGRTAVSVSAGYDTTCVVLDDATTRCWGSNHVGQLGLGGEVPLQPGEVPPDENYHAWLGDNELPTTRPTVGIGSALAVATGTFHSCAVLTANTVNCWGAGNNGRTGHGDEARIGDNEAPSSAGTLSLGGNVGGPVSSTTTTSTTTLTPTTTTPGGSTTSTTTPTTAPTTTPAPTTTTPAPAPAPEPTPVPAPADTTPPDLHMWRTSPARVARDGRVCVFITSDETAITAFAVDVPGKGQFRSPVSGVHPGAPAFLCLTLPRSARPTRATTVTFTAAGLDRAVNLAFDVQRIVLTK